MSTGLGGPYPHSGSAPYLCVLGQIISLFKPPFCYLENEDKNSADFTWGFDGYLANICEIQHITSAQEMMAVVVIVPLTPRLGESGGICKLFSSPGRC